MDPWNVVNATAAAVAAATAVGAIVVAVRANGRADAAIEEARRANAISEKSLSVAQESLAAQQQSLPPAWSQATPVGKDRVSFTNTSGRHIIITSLKAEPDEVGDSVQAPPRPHRVEHGDAFAIQWWPTLSTPAPTKLRIQWHFEDLPESAEKTERNL